MKNTKSPKKAKREHRVIKLTPKDIQTLHKDPKFETFGQMLELPLYKFRILKYLYGINELSPAGFLNNDNIFNVSLGYKKKNVVYIRDGILDLYTRFKLANELATNGEAMTAFMIDNDDTFFEYFVKLQSEGDDTEGTYPQEFSAAYNMLANRLLNMDVNEFIDSNAELLNSIEKTEQIFNKKKRDSK